MKPKLVWFFPVISSAVRETLVQSQTITVITQQFANLMNFDVRTLVDSINLYLRVYTFYNLSPNNVFL